MWKMIPNHRRKTKDMIDFFLVFMNFSGKYSLLVLPKEVAEDTIFLQTVSRQAPYTSKDIKIQTYVQDK